MKKFTLKTLSMLLVMLLAGIVQAHAGYDETTKTLTLQDGDIKANGGSGDKGMGCPLIEVDDYVTVVMPKGTFPNWVYYGMAFAPKNEGEVLQVTLEESNLSTEKDFLLFYYDRDITGEKFSSSIKSEYGTTLLSYPGERNTTILKDETIGTPFITRSPDGRISLVYYATGYKSCREKMTFKLKVQAVKPGDMTFKEAKCTQAENLFRGQFDAQPVTLTVSTEGYTKNPAMDATFDISPLKQIGATNIRLYNEIQAFNAEPKLLGTADGDATTISCSGQTLLNGDNNYYILVDMPADFHGVLPPISVSSLTVGGQSKDVPAPTSTQVDQEIRMQRKTAAYTISDEMSFFDDGGKDGNARANTRTTLTFVPSTPGNAVQINFTKMGYYLDNVESISDSLVIYNGRNVDPDNIKRKFTPSTPIPVVVRSTADDGSLTVRSYRRSKTAEGFEAIVSEFTPSDMVVKNVAVTEQVNKTNTVSAVQKNARMAILDVFTDGQGKPLHLTGVNVKSTTPDLYTGAKVYTLGETTTVPPRDSALKPYGEGSTGQAPLTVTGDLALAEGHNYFLICADFNTEPRNGQKINLTAEAIVGEITIPAEGTVEKTVENTWYSVDGKSDIILYDNWNYQHTPDYYSPSKYSESFTDQIATFSAANEGEMVQIDFSKFDIGAPGIFQVYNGSEVDENALIWEKTTDNRTKGPGYTLSSTTEAGALTIVFNSNTKYFSGVGSGWLATVRPFKNHDMEIVGALAKRPTTDDIARGVKNQPILEFTLNTEGTLTTATVKKVNLTLTGASAYETVNVWASNGSDRNQAVLFSKVAAPEAEVAVTGEFEITGASCHFWVEADTKADATLGTKMSAAVNSVSYSPDKTYTFEGTSGNPTGDRTLKEMIIMEAGEHIINLTPTKINFYDDGGSTRAASPNVEATYVLIPKEGYVINIDTESFSMGSGNITIYSGQEADPMNVLGNENGYNYTTGPSNLRSTASDGSVTIVVKTSSASMPGFGLIITQEPKKNFEAGSLSDSDFEDIVVRGQKNAVVAKIKIPVEGDMGAAKASKFKFNLDFDSETDFEALHLYYTGKSDIFRPEDAVKIGDVTDIAEYTAEFVGEIDLKTAGDHWFVITADVSPEAVEGGYMDISLESLLFNGVTSGNEIWAGYAEIVAGFAGGEYTIGEDGNYATIGDALKAISDANNAIEGQVVFKILPGTYTEAAGVKIENLKGSSPEARLIFRGSGSSRDDAALTCTSSSSYYFFTLLNSPYVTVENLTLNRGITLTNSSNFTLDNCCMTARSVETIYDSSNPGNCDYLTIENCQFDRTVTLSVKGTSDKTRSWQRGLVLRGNKFDCHSSGANFELINHVGAIIENNVFSAYAYDGTAAVVLQSLEGETRFCGNQVLAYGEATTSGLVISSNSGRVKEPSNLKIYNNEITIRRNGKSNYAVMHFKGNSSNVMVDYNTLRLSENVGSVVRTDDGATISNIAFSNNIFENDCAADEPVIYLGAEGHRRGMTFKNNAFKTKNPKVLLSLAGTTSDIDQFNHYFDNRNESNKEVFVQFYGERDAHLVWHESLMAGTPVAHVTHDRDQRVRNAEAPTVGAYEFLDDNHIKPAPVTKYYDETEVHAHDAIVHSMWNASGTLYALQRLIDPSHYVIKGANEPVALTDSDLPENYDAPTIEELKSQGMKTEVKRGELVSLHVSPLNAKRNHRMFYYLETPDLRNSGLVYGNIVVTNDITSGIEDITAAGNAVEITAQSGAISIKSALDDFRVEVYAPSGMLVANKAVSSGETMVEVTQGVYLVRVTTASGATVRRILVR